MLRVAARRAAFAAIAPLIASLLPAACGRKAVTPPPGVAPGSSDESPAAAPGGPSQGEPAADGLRLFRAGDYDGAEPLLVAALRAAPKDARILEALGRIYQKSDRFQKAEESLRAVLAVDPSSVGGHLGLAAVCIDTGRYDEALAEIATARRIDPGNITALVKEALLDARSGRPDEAEKAARAALGRRPDDAEAHYVLGLALLQKGAIDGAEREMRRVRALLPDHLGALSHLVTIATRLGRSREAETFRRAHQEALARRRIEDRVRGHRLKGVEAFNRGDYTTALEEFQTIAREDPGDPQIYLHLGSTFIALKRLEEARGALERCLALEPRNDRALAELGRAYALSNRLDEAVAALRKAIAVNPEFPEPHYYLAGVYMARGDPVTYRDELRIYRELRARSAGAASEVVPDDEIGP